TPTNWPGLTAPTHSDSPPGGSCWLPTAGTGDRVPRGRGHEATNSSPTRTGSAHDLPLTTVGLRDAAPHLVPVVPRQALRPARCFPLIRTRTESERGSQSGSQRPQAP